MSPLSRFAHIVLATLLVSGTMECLRAAEKHPKSNEGILFQVCDKAVQDFFTETRITDTTQIVLKIGGGEINGFFAQTLIESFRRQFSSLYVQQSVPGVEISASIREVSVAYGEPFSESFLSARKCERQIEVDVRLTAVRLGDGKILWAGSKSASYADTVFVSEIQNIQQSSEHIARGVMPVRSAMERFIEPFIIVSAAGVAIYLFFTIRS